MQEAGKQQSDVVVIAKFFDMKGKEALENIKALSDQDKQQLGNGIRDGSLNY